MDTPRHRDTPDIAAWLEARTRLDLSLAALPIIHVRQRERMLTWLERMLFDAGTARSVDIGVTVTWNRQRLCWRVAGEREVAYVPVMEYLDTVGAARRALPAFERLGEHPDARSIGGWLEAGEHSLETGWWCPDPLPLAHALAFLPDTPDRNTVAAWAGEHGVDTCTCLTRSVHPDRSWTELWLPLPGDTLDQLCASRSVYSALSMPMPDNAAYAGLMRSATRPLMFVIGLARGGPVRIGIAAARPTLEGVAQLAQLGDGGFDEAAQAAFEEALGAGESPVAVTWLQNARGAGAELHYAVARR